VKPDVVTLVPEKRAEQTTEGGLDLVGTRATVEKAIQKLSAAGIPVSLFIDASEAAVRASHELKAPRIELHTGDYCEEWTPIAGADAELLRLHRAAELGTQLGLHVAAGHGLDYPNVEAVAAIREIEELNIGHAIVARAVLVGMERAVREMIEAMRRARP
jgi:pyridoxine 5-phosphate synthase